MLQVKGTHGVIEACVPLLCVRYGLGKYTKFIYNFEFASSFLFHQKINSIISKQLIPSRFLLDFLHDDKVCFSPCNSPLPCRNQSCGQSSSDYTSTRNLLLQTSNLSPRIGHCEFLLYFLPLDFTLSNTTDRNVNARLLPPSNATKRRPPED
jgi:hypothetical protein